MRKAIIRKLALCASFLNVSVLFAGCSEIIKVQPVAPVEELAENIAPQLDIVNSIEKSNDVPPETVSNPNDILRKKNFKIYFDNTTGCFKGYADLYQKDPQDPTYQAFAQTMKAFREAFETFTSYTLQPGQDAVHQWTENSQIFSNFGVSDSYTNGRGIIPAETSPMNMMLPDVEQSFQKKDDSVFVYISDLNEQNGRLPDASVKIKELMEKYPDKDVLIISYDMAFRGTISAATAELEGNSSRQVDSRTFDDTINRKYYIVAFGDHVTLSALLTSIGNNFQEIGVEMQSFLYRDTFYTKKETQTLAPDNQVMQEDFFSAYAPKFSILDGKGNVVDLTAPEAPPADAPPADPLGDLDALDNLDQLDPGNENPPDASAPLVNLELCHDPAEIFTEKITGDSYIFRSLKPDYGSEEAEFGIRLDNADVYTLDTQNAVIYTYQNTDDSGMSEDASTFSWILAEGGAADLNAYGISLIFDGDTTKLKLNQTLSAEQNIPLCVVSIPLNFSYRQETTVKDVTVLPEGFTDWVNSCKAGAAGTDEAYTKTYAFDSFMDKLTGYRALSDSEELVNAEDKTVDLLPETPELVDRLNIIIAADERE